MFEKLFNPGTAMLTQRAVFWIVIVCAVVVVFGFGLLETLTRS